MGNKRTICHIQIKGDEKSRFEEIDLFPFVIGRGDEADLKIMASGVSRSHLSVSLKENSIWIEDLGSANGTFVNGKKIEPKVPTKYNPGDSVRLGLNNDLIILDLVEEKNPEHHAIVLPPIPNHVPDKQAPTPEDMPPPVPQIMMKPKAMAKPEEVKPAVSAAELAEASATISAEYLQEAKATAFRIKVAAETEATKILQAANETARAEISRGRDEAVRILTQATDQAHRLQREGEAEATKMRQTMQEAISKVHAETEERVEKTLKEARLSAIAIKAAAQGEADGTISKAFQKALEIKTKGEEEFKEGQRQEKKKANEIIEKSQSEADKILEEAHSTSIKIRENVDKEIEAIKARVENEARKGNEDIIAAAKSEAEKIKADALKTAKKTSEDVLRSERENHRSAFEKENKNLMQTLLAGQTALKSLEEERSRLHNSIESYKAKEAKLLKDFEETKAKLTIEHDALKAKLTNERDDLKKKMISSIAEEEKVLMEKAKADFDLQKETLEAKFTKTRVLEISKALEIYILPRLKKSLNWEETPDSLNNFSADLRDIVKRVMNGEFSEAGAEKEEDTFFKHKGYSRPLKTFLYLTVVAAFAFIGYSVFQNPSKVLRKPASLIRPKFQKPSPLITSEEYKNSYTDNVLYTEGYVALKLSPKNQEIWKTEFDDFFKNDLGFKNSSDDKFIELELQLIRRLAALRAEINSENKKENLQTMAALEKISVDQFIEILGSQENYAAFRDFEKKYIEKTRGPASQN